MKTELSEYLINLTSSIVTKSTAGGGAGSIIKIEFNDEDSLQIIYIECAWRIEKKDKVIATSADDIKAVTGLIAQTARLLEGKTVEFIEINPFYDLNIKFTDDLRLRVFCIFSYTHECDVNWQLWIPYRNLSFEITNQFRIKKGKYN